MIPVRSRAAFRICQILFLVSTTAIAQNTINVPADQPTIQGAINVAASGDTVLVAPGTYVENINFSGKAITVTSSSGAASTIIDGNVAGSVVTFNQGESNSAVLNGFTIQNGHASEGAGIYVSGASPKITNNVIANNSGIYGLGIAVENGSPAIQGNTVTGNVENMGSSGFGGAIYVGASYGVTANASVIGNVITNNHIDAGGFGGGICVDYFAAALIENNYIAGNSAYNGGGGIYAQSYATITIADNIISNNNSGSGGDGGGFYENNSGPLLFLNNTLYGNTSNSGTSEIAALPYYSLNSTFKNNIVYATSGSAVSCSATNGVTGSNNLVYSAGTATNGSCAAFDVSNGNLAADPLLKDPLNGDFHLQPGSPAIDAGDITSPSLPAQDYAGAARLGDDSGQCNFVIDLGVYESHPAAPGAVSLSSASLSFPDTGVGSTSAPLPLVLNGTGQGCFRITGFNLSGDFAQSNSCRAGVPAGQSCTVQVTFAPTDYGPRSGSLTIPINTNAGTPPSPVTLSGQGGIPQGSISPSALSFPGQNINTSSSPQTITLANYSPSILRVNSIVVSGPAWTGNSAGSADFTQTNNCGAQIAPGASCSIQVTFAPTANGQRNGTLLVVSNSNPIVPSVPLTGQGLGPQQGSFSPATLSFSQQAVNTTSTPQSVLLTNNGSQTLNIAGFSVTGDYAETNNCPAALAPNAYCAIQITFTPTTVGSRQGALSVSSDSVPAVPALSINGTGEAAIASVTPSSLTFGSQLVGTTSAAQAVTLANTGNLPLSISQISTAAPFQQSNSCGSSVAPGASCVISVTYQPTARQVSSGSLVISSNASGGTNTIALSGSGIGPAGTVNPTSLTFTQQLVGTTSSPQSFTLSSTGETALSIQSISVSAPFAQTNNCGSSLAAGATCTINVTFAPTSLGPASGNLALYIPGTSQMVALSGTGLAPVATFSPASFTFATQRVGTTSPQQLVTLSNTGNSVLTISSIGTIGAIVFSETNNCPATLAPGSSCAINVTFRPVQSGTYYGDIDVFDDSGAVSGSEQRALLTGPGGASTATLSAASLAFGTAKVGTSTAPAAVTISNSGTMALNISSIAASGDFSQSNNCGTSVAPGGNCVINVVFTPTATGARTGSLAISSDAQNGNVQTASLWGTGALPVANLSAASLTFATTPAGTQSGSSAVTLTNNGAVPMNISSIAISGDFTQGNNCPAALAPSATCTINVTFAPTAAGTRTGLLTIADDASGGSQTVSLSGSATDFSVTVSPTSSSINPGQHVSYNPTIHPLGGAYNQTVSLTCSGMPAGATCTVTPTSLVLGGSSQNAKVNITTSSGTPAGTYTLVVTGVANGAVRSGTATLIVK
jgi:hypothetical protein